MLDALRELPGFRDVTSNMDLASPNLVVDIDRNKAATLGITAEKIETALSNSFGFGGTNGSLIFRRFS